MAHARIVLCPFSSSPSGGQNIPSGVHWFRKASISPLVQASAKLSKERLIAIRRSLSLAPDVAYDEIVGVPSALRPSVLRVSPGQPSQSWLVAMISADDAVRQGFSRMPLATQPLTPNQIETIVRWIEQGALRN